MIRCLEVAEQGGEVSQISSEPLHPRGDVGAIRLELDIVSAVPVSVNDIWLESNDE